MEFVKVVMSYPFAYDAYIECYIQLTGNEKEVAFLFSVLKDDFNFCEVYTNEEVDNIFKNIDNRYTNNCDREDYVKLEGKIKIDINAEIDDIPVWWQDLIESVKTPKFENISEKVTREYIYNNKAVYDPAMYKPKN